ncbi:MAG: hypothetical protein Alpg2KO_25990 [Alphaproteobacteria bacterium]
MALSTGSYDQSLMTRAGTAIPGQISAAVKAGATASGADFGYLLAQAGVESSFRPDLQASSSSATGLFQFIEQTWLGMVHRHGDAHGLSAEQSAITRGADGRLSVDDPKMKAHILDLRRDPELSARMAGELAAENADRLEKTLGRAPDETELYLAHFLGAGGASRFLTAHQQDPDQSAAALLPQAAQANPRIFNDPATGQPRSLEQIRQEMSARLDRHSASGLQLAAGMSEPSQASPSEVADMPGAVTAQSVATDSALPERQIGVSAVPGSIARLSPLTSWLLAEVQSGISRL